MVLSTLDAGLDALDEPAAFFFGNHCGDIGDEFPDATGTNLVDSAVGDRHSGIGVFTALEEALVDATEPRQP